MTDQLHLPDTLTAEERAVLTPMEQRALLRLIRRTADLRAQARPLPTLPCDGVVYVGQAGAHVVGVWTNGTRAQAEIIEIADRQGRPITDYSVHLVPFFGFPHEIRP